MAAETQPRRRYTRLCLAHQRLDAAFPEPLLPNAIYHYASGGVWSAHDLLLHLIRTTTGPARLTATTWTMSSGPCQALISALHAGHITAMAMLFDWRVQVRCPEAVGLAQHYATDVRLSTCHAKVYVLENMEWGVVMLGSANLTNNPRIEAGIVDTNVGAAQFHARWIRAEIANAAPFGIDMGKGHSDGRK